MKIYNVTDKEFAPYGKIVEGYDVSEILNALANETPLPNGVDYVPEEPAIQNLASVQKIATNLYGGMPAQFGWCNGHNTKLNCLEYHRDSEFNLGTQDFILLLARIDDIENGVLNTEKVKAFKAPAGVLIECYATSLHYAPCHTNAENGFKVLVALPKGTNTAKPEIEAISKEDELLWACNKWLLAHENSSEAKDGAKVCLVGENIDIASLI